MVSKFGLGWFQMIYGRSEEIRIRPIGELGAQKTTG